MFILPWLEIIRDIFHKNEFPIFINIIYLSGDKHFEGVFDIIKQTVALKEQYLI